METEMVNHPKHYNQYPIECIEFKRYLSSNLGDALKYIWRAGAKPGVESKQDLEKAKWYLLDELNTGRKFPMRHFINKDKMVEVILTEFSKRGSKYANAVAYIFAASFNNSMFHGKKIQSFSFCITKALDCLQAIIDPANTNPL